MRILFTKPNGNVCVVHGAPKLDVEKSLGALTIEQYKKFIWDKSIPADAINPMEIDEGYVLPGREFRNAWKQSNKEVTHDLQKAKDMRLVKVREQRDEILTKYDGLQSRAQDLNLTQELAYIKSVKQQLRDSTNLLKALNPASLEDIKNATPDLSVY